MTYEGATVAQWYSTEICTMLKRMEYLHNKAQTDDQKAEVRLNVARALERCVETINQMKGH
jgi:hypothetical protein